MTILNIFKYYTYLLLRVLFGLAGIICAGYVGLSVVDAFEVGVTGPAGMTHLGNAAISFVLAIIMFAIEEVIKDKRKAMEDE